MRFQYKFFLLIVPALLTTACMVGPNFHSPKAPSTLTYTGSPLTKKTRAASGHAGKSQHFILGKKLPAKWWELFRSQELNYLMRAGLTNSPNIAAAKAALVQAQETLNAQVGSTMLPAFSVQAGGERELFSAASLGTSNLSSNNIFNVFNASVNVAYTLDFFGGARRSIENVAAQVDFQVFELEAAYLTMTTNITTTAITIASLKAQIEATEALIHDQQQQLDIVRKQFRAGGVSKADVFSQETQLAQTRATLPPLQQNLAQNLHALSILIGFYPDEKALPHFNLEKFYLPTQLPVSLPSSLVRQRPDIRASEALLHAASAQIGVATANLYPQFNITGSYGWQGLVASHLFSKNNNTWNIAGQITEPLFNGGALLAKKRAAVAAYQQAAAQYQQTVLQAFKNVADTLRALEHDAQALHDQQQAEAMALKTLRLTEQQYRVGAVSYLNLLTAQRTYQQTRINRIQAEAARYIDTATLFQALGGGWWNRTPLVCKKSAVSLSQNLAQYSPNHFGREGKR